MQKKVENPTTNSAIEIVHGRRRSGNAPLSRELFISLWSLYCSSSHAQQHWKLTHTWNSSTNHSFYWLLLLFSVFCVGQKQFASCWPAFVSSPAHSVHSVGLSGLFATLFEVDLDIINIIYLRAHLNISINKQMTKAYRKAEQKLEKTNNVHYIILFQNLNVLLSKSIPLEGQLDL